jgi:xanthine dehydrogenase accessory factor
LNVARWVLLRGGGDLASGVALRLFRAGIKVYISELAEPLAVRRTVSFAQAVYDGHVQVEEVVARLAHDPREVISLQASGSLPVLIDPPARSRLELNPLVIVDGRMTKQPPDLDRGSANLVVGLGPGFVAGDNCHAVVETRRGPFLGRVIWQGAAEPDTGLPDLVSQVQVERVLRAPVDGILMTHAEIGDHLQAGQLIAEVAGVPVRSLFPGILRGLLKPGMAVRQGLKIGDLDPRDDPRLARWVSDKSLAIGGGVLEAILSKPMIRKLLW